MKDIENLKSRLVKPMPLLVHCSAGIGRSGVLIMLEIGLALFQEDRPVDMDAILTKLRAQRMGMVQTKVRAWAQGARWHGVVVGRGVLRHGAAAAYSYAHNSTPAVFSPYASQPQYDFVHTTLATVRREEGPGFGVVP